MARMGMGGLIIVASKRGSLTEAWLMAILGGLGCVICVAVILVAGKHVTLTTVAQVSVGTVALIVWAHIFYGTWHVARRPEAACSSGASVQVVSAASAEDSVKVTIAGQDPIASLDSKYSGGSRKERKMRVKFAFKGKDAWWFHCRSMDQVPRRGDGVAVEAGPGRVVFEVYEVVWMFLAGEETEVSVRLVGTDVGFTILSYGESLLERAGWERK